jgi:hypothetical protein
MLERIAAARNYKPVTLAGRLGRTLRSTALAASLVLGGTTLTGCEGCVSIASKLLQPKKKEPPASRGGSYSNCNTLDYAGCGPSTPQMTPPGFIYR